MDFINEDQFKSKIGIYSITNTVTGKQYIGQTGQAFDRRYWHHRWKLREGTHDNKHLQRSWEKYGEEAFVFNVVYVANSRENLDKLEQKYINEFDTYKNGYNMTEGGSGKRGCPMSERAKAIVGAKNRVHNLGKKASPETRAKMSRSSKHTRPTEEHKQKLRERMVGRTVSEETRKKLSERFRGENSPSATINTETAAKIKRMLMSGLTQREISQELDIKYGVVSCIKLNKNWKHVLVDGWDEWCAENNK